MAVFIDLIMMGAMTAAEIKAQDEQAEAICKQTAELKQQYNEYYNSCVDALNQQTLASKGVRDRINGLRGQVTQSNQRLRDIRDNFKRQMTMINVCLAVSVVITGVMLYLKHKGMLTLNPLAGMNK